LFAIWLHGGDEIVISIKNMKFYTWTAMPSEKRMLSYSSQHGDEDGYTLSLCCKFEINLRLFASYLAGCDKMATSIEIRIFTLGLPCHLTKE